MSRRGETDVVQEAMRLCAWGYVFQTHAEANMLASFDAVLSGKAFVTCALALARCANSEAGVMNMEEPQSRQTRSLGNTRTLDSSTSLRLEKWTATSAENSF